MEWSIIRVTRRIVSLLAPDSVSYKGVVIPAKHLRSGGKPFRRDEHFLASAQAEAQRLIEHFGLAATSRVLDVGCGVGRLAIGILDQLGEIGEYRGVDVNETATHWCQEHLTPQHPGFQFIHLEAGNPRYNPRGRQMDAGFRLAFDDERFDIVYLYSVFSHMTTEDVVAYLREFRRLLPPSGRLFLTAFIEDGVPDMTVNPRGYGDMRWVGPLHCVRYDRSFFESLLADSGFGVDRLDHGVETGGQSALYVSLRTKAVTRQERHRVNDVSPQGARDYPRCRARVTVRQVLSVQSRWRRCRMIPGGGVPSLQATA